MPIFEQGYQHWEGQRAGLAMRWWTIARHGARVERRWWLTRLFSLLGIIPALILTMALVFWGLVEQKSGLVGWLIRQLPDAFQTNPKAFRVVIWTIAYQYFFMVQIFYCMLMVVIVGPRLISQDLRFNAIPLYLSRPLRRIDYFFGKWGVIAVFVAAVAISPAVLAWVLGVFFSLDPSTIADTWRVLLGAIGYGLVIVISAGTLMLAFSSLSKRSGYVVIIWFGFWIITNLVGGTVTGIAVVNRQQQQYYQEVRKQQAQGQPVVAPPDDVDLGRAMWYQAISYTTNIQRVGNALLGTQDAWQRFQDVSESMIAGQAMGQPRLRFPVAQASGTAYPWPLAAGVLVGLFALSALILQTRVRTLDRLR